MPAKASILDELGLAPDEMSGRMVVVTGSGRAAALAYARLGAKAVIAELYDQGQESENLIWRGDRYSVWADFCFAESASKTTTMAKATTASASAR